MAKVNAFLQDRFETVEAFAVIDVLRRAGIEVETVSLMDRQEVTSAQNVTVRADIMYEDCDFSKTDMFFLPGGPGTSGYEKNEEFIELIKEAYKAGKWIAAICAAPSILGHMGILEGKKATCFPGYEKDLYGAEYVDTRVITDGKIITGKGMGTSIDLGLEIVRNLISEEKSVEVGMKAQYLR